MTDEPAIEGLPVELLEQIVGYLLPTLKERRHRPIRNREFLPEEPRISAGVWRLDAVAIRLVCKSFSQLSAPCTALFHDFILWTSPRSIGNLHLLSQVPKLRHYVRRVVFVQPMFSAPLVDMRVFHLNIDEDLRDRLQIALFGSRGRVDRSSEVVAFVLGENWNYYEHISRKYSNMSRPSLEAAHQEFTVCHQIQQQLLSEPSFTAHIGTALSKLPQLRSVHISAEHGGERSSGEGTENLNWLQKHYPDLLLQTRGLNARKHKSWDIFISQIFQTLSRSNTQIEELAFVHHHGIDSKFARSAAIIPGWPGLTCLSVLRRLDITLRFVPSHRPPHRGFMQVVLPLVGKMSNLEELIVQAPSLVLNHDDGSFNNLLSLRLPNLKLFQWDSFRARGRSLAVFILAHPHLEVLTLVTDGLIDNQWKLVWNAIHDHPNTLDLCISGITSFGTILSGNPNYECMYPELYEHLQRKGAWTEKLEELFPAI